MHHQTLKEQFLAHSQARINAAMNNYAVKASTDVVDKATQLGVNTQLFARMLEKLEIF